jgi:hypothetical protein
MPWDVDGPSFELTGTLAGMTDDATLPDPGDGQRRREEQERLAWGSWRQDRELNRRKVLRALLGLLVVVVLAGMFAYACDRIRGPQQLHLSSRVTDFTLQPPDDESQQLLGRYQAAGAVGPAVGRYTGPPGTVLFAVGLGTALPTDVLARLLPDATGGDITFEGNGGPISCAPTAQGSRCVYKNGNEVGGTSAAGITPPALAEVTRTLRIGVTE